MAAYLPNQDCRLDDRSRSPNQSERPTARSSSRPRRPTEPIPSRPAHRHRRLPSSTSPERRQRSRSAARSRQRQERPSYWQYSCGLCQEDHALSACERFRHQTPFQRYETVERRGYCRNCLARSHLAPDCPSLTGCRRCNNRHHTLLHGASQLEEVSLNVEVVTTPNFAWDLVFVPTAMVRIKADKIEGYSMLRALISQSATMSKISYAAFRRLGLQSRIYKGQRFTTFTVSPRRTNSHWSLRVNAVIIEDLPRRIYSDPILEDPTRSFRNCALADPDPRGNNPVDVELGADVYSAIRKDECKEAGIGDVLAYDTQLGYVFAGPIKNMPKI
ncbi:uncharacterized protein LOC131802024 [Musca domestica]|uniref:Uncharacterized protein LOC131802024 n=1 Tax=Musca domestica TaxID=7370 RepID=A0ABM3UUY4_MUSDO|nr:uncharacterized protein LOC131802024 [Musca domestica]